MVRGGLIAEMVLGVLEGTERERERERRASEKRRENEPRKINSDSPRQRPAELSAAAPGRGDKAIDRMEHVDQVKLPACLFLGASLGYGKLEGIMRPAKRWVSQQ